MRLQELRVISSQVTIRQPTFKGVVELVGRDLRVLLPLWLKFALCGIQVILEFNL